MEFSETTEADTARPEQEIIFKPNPGPQTEFLAATELEVLYGGAAGGGKVVSEQQSILTPSGWKSCPDLQVGDEICDPHGDVQTIQHLFAWEALPKWEVELDDGTIFDTAQEHLWKYWIAGEGEVRAKVASTRQMELDSESSGRKAVIPTITTLFLQSQTVQLDPYTLGAWLGDGCITTESPTYSTHDDDAEFFREHLDHPEDDFIRMSKGFRLRGPSRNEFTQALKNYGLMGTNSNSKFVPQEYLWNTEDVRLAILQGLMDTDGHRDAARARAEYATVSPRLAEGVRHLAQSLGYRVSTYTKIGSYLNDLGERVRCQKVYRLYITGRDVDEIFRMPRKKTGVVGKQLGRRVVDIRKTAETFRGRCITVSNPDGLYVTDDFIVTHNSYALIADPVRYFSNSDFNGLLLRRTNDELKQLISDSKRLYPRVIPGAKFLEREKFWTFPSGATFWMSFLDRDDDKERYQGAAYQWIGVDELGQWPSPEPWDYLRSRLRSASGLPLSMRGSANPGGAGQSWLKKMFIDPAPWNTPFDATDIETREVLRYPESVVRSGIRTPHPKAGQPMHKRRFIPASLYDNPYLSDDGVYEQNLLSLPEHLRKQLLEGDWNAAVGQAFPEFNRRIHTCDPFDIPRDWVKFRACDYGYGSFSGILWFAVAPSGQVFVYREMYVSKVTARDLMIMILEAEAGEKIRYGMLDSSLWHTRGEASGESLHDQMNVYGSRWKKADRSRGARVAGKNQIHHYMQSDEILEEPKLIIFNHCTNLIAQLPSIPLNKKNPEDVDTNSEDHLYDALRYGLMSRPGRFARTIDFYDDFEYTPQFKPADKTFGY